MSEISVSVVGSSSINPTVGNGDTVNVTINPTGERGPVGDTGPAGPANKIVLGTVKSGADADATLTSQAVVNGVPTQTLSLVLPQGATGETGQQGIQGPTGPATTLSIGTVSNGDDPAVTITGDAPSQTISFVLPKGDKGDTGSPGPYTTIKVGSTTTGNPGTQASVSSATAGDVVTLSFTVPRGVDGTANLGDETPQPLGVASSGSSPYASRADHVHAVPVISFTNLTDRPAAYPPSSHSHAISDVTNLQAVLDSKQAAGNYPTLDGNGKISSSFLPSYVDDVVEYQAVGSFPSQGESGKLYVALDTRKLWRWSGTGYVEIAGSPGSTDSVAEGTNLYFTNARAAAAAPVQSVNGQTGNVTIEAGGIAWSSVPTATSDKTSAGAISYDPSYVYVATNTDMWRRAGLEDWTTPTITINTQPGDATAVGGEATFTVVASVTQGAELLYQWQRQAGGSGSWANVSGGLSASLTLTNLQYAVNNGDKYRCVITSGAAGTGGTAVSGWLPAVVVELTPTATATSDSGTLTVLAAISITVQPQSVTLVSDTTASFSVSATTPGSGLSYQWQSSPDGSNWTTIEGATSSTLAFTGLNQSNDQTRYRCVVSSSGYDDVTSAAAKLTVNPILVTTQPKSQTASPGTGTTPNYNATLSVAGTCPAGAPSLQWQVSTDAGSSWSDVSGATTTSLSLTGLAWADSGKKYRARLNKTGWSEVTSSAATVSVPTDVISVTQQPSNTTASVSAYSATAYTLPSGTYNAISYANGKWFATPNDTLGGDYIATSDSGTTWTKRIAALPYAGQWSKVLYGNGVYLTFLADGSASGTRCATSTDGVTWTARQISATSGLAAYGHMFLAAGGGWFVAFNGGGSTSARWVQSQDGVTWTTVAQSTNSVSETTTFAASLDGTQVMAYSATTYSTVSVATVSQSGLGQFASAGIPFSGYAPAHVIHDGTTFVAVNQAYGSGVDSSAKWVSGSTWTRGAFGAAFIRVAYRAGRYVAVTQNGIASSSDGVNWVLRQATTGFLGSSFIVATSAGFVATTYNYSQPSLPYATYTSNDGLSWTLRASNDTSSQIAEVAGNKALVSRLSTLSTGSLIDVGGITSASFSSAASTLFGSPSLQWQRSADGGSTWASVSGATYSPYQFQPTSADNGAKYRAVFSKDLYTTVNSNAATLTVP